MATTGAVSSLRMVAVATAVPMVAPLGAESLTVNTSSLSRAWSLATLMVIDLNSSPAAKLSVLVASPPRKSAALAWPAAVVTATSYLTVTEFCAAPLRATLNTNGVVPPAASPSASEAWAEVMASTGSTGT